MDIRIRKGTVDDVEALILFLEEVRNGMDHPEWFYLDPPDAVRKYMRSGTMQLWLAMDGDQIAAIFDYLIPQMDDYNYGYDLDFEQEALLRVINMDNSAVHPSYRGLGLQRKMIEIAEEYIRSTGPHILLCTVHPDNRFSLEHVLKQGYTIQKKLSKYGSVRYLLRKDIF